MFEAFGVLLRFPFFLAGITLLSIFIIPLWVLGFIIQIVGLPFVFISSAFTNDKSRWEYKVKDLQEMFTSEFFAKPYRACYNWLVGKKT